jgi:hypothetical protein
MRPWVLGVIAAAAAVASASEASPPWQVWSDLADLPRLGGDYGSHLVSSYCLDGCRYDRSSLDPGRGGQRFVRIESTAEGEQGVLLDQPGAGAVTRIWMTTGDGVSQPLPSDVRLRIYLDGEAVPALEQPLDAFFRDAAPPRDAASLATDRLLASGGNVSYRPFVYRNGIKIALLHGADRRLWYQINYVQTPEDAASGGAAPAVDADALMRRLAEPSNADRVLAARLPFGRGRDGAALLPGATSEVLAADAPLVLLRRDGAGTLRSMRVQLDRERWDDVQLSIAVDGAATVDLPIARFFTADVTDTLRPLGLLAGVDALGAFYARLPMPYRRDLEVSLRLRDGADSRPVTVRHVFDIDPAPPPADAGVLHAQAHAACPTTPQLTGDEVLLRHEGSGRLVGLAVWMSGDGVQEGGYYLEGDERLYIDGSVQPSWYGTGVEDLFNGGFYFDRGAYVGPLAGAPLRHPGTTDDATSMYRWFLADAPRWRRSIVYKLENGAWGDQPLCLRSVAFYYASREPAQEIVAALQLGDAASEAAADYRRGSDARCAVQEALFGDEPATWASAQVCRARTPSRFTLSVPRQGAAFRLRRTFDAGVEGQAAQILVNGVRVGAWGDTQANPARRWSQTDVDFVLPLPADVLSFEIRPLPGRRLTESRYELFAAVEAESGGG